MIRQRIPVTVTTRPQLAPYVEANELEIVTTPGALTTLAVTRHGQDGDDDATLTVHFNPEALDRLTLALVTHARWHRNPMEAP